MKKFFIIIALVAVLSFSISGCAELNGVIKARNEIMQAEVSNESADDNDYVKSIWISYYELEGFTNGKDEAEFYNSINSAFKELSLMGFNTVTVQVRPCADAFYKSAYFPSSKYCFGEQGSEMPYDPLSIMCDLAHNNKLKIEAWINPYRVSQDSDIDELCDSNIAKQWYESEDKTSNVYIEDTGIYFNPSCPDANELIVNGVKEIIENYNVDSIHFDDYFYPSKEEEIDKKEYAEYKAGGGKLSLNDWRRENVSKMIKSVYSTVKSVNKSVEFGISPASNINNDYNNLYADVEKWAGEEGYTDYVCPQIYFGFRNVYQPFMFTTKKWIGITNCKLYVGLPLYKSGKYDKYAAENDESIKNEFVDNNDIISRQITYLSKLDEIKGFYIFSYSCLQEESCKAEVENMLKVMQSSSQD